MEADALVVGRAEAGRTAEVTVEVEMWAVNLVEGWLVATMATQVVQGVASVAAVRRVGEEMMEVEAVVVTMEAVREH